MKRKQPRKKVGSASLPLDAEVIGLDHPLADEAMVRRLLPDGVRVPLSDLKTVGFLITHPAEFEETPFARAKAIAASLQAAVERDFRDAQERNLKTTGKARP